MIDKISSTLASHIKKSVPDHHATEEVLQFSLGIILNAGFIITLTLLISIGTGHIISALIALTGFAILRQLTGGLHLQSGTWCVFVSTLLFTGISLISLPEGVTAIITVLALIVVAVMAPKGLENQSRIDPKHFWKMKLAASVIVATNLIFQSTTLALCFFVQVLLLIPGKEVENS
ncbi:accessory gene regulator ArgB-like protein [Paenibacillus sp. S150]|uniref:accessory gene regulator ArgB-like protein n=1 Tax=Paenibacillus sp. S150 TaxID=2749826 RepID=UPI001C5637E2|nr:accessory gene regulator B family protein [Paenibacillus sp. S150]MBW4083561.1 accessory gene regulator B family protein [Paenibacillus sp. S150]